MILIIDVVNKKKYFFKKKVKLLNLIKIIFFKKNDINSYIAIKVDGILRNLNYVIYKNSRIELIKKNNIVILLKLIRSTSIFLLNKSVKILFPEIKISKNKITKEGFYCDFYYKKNIDKLFISNVENKMIEFINDKEYLIKDRNVKNINYLINLFMDINEIYKVKIINNYVKKNRNIYLYFHNEYYDICNIPNLYNINYCLYFKIYKIVNVKYYNKIFKRIYVSSWNSFNKLNASISRLKEAKRRDHRKINKIINLYHINKKSPGMLYWHDSGLIIFNKLKSLIRKELKKNNYIEVKTPIFMDINVWNKTGHLNNYSKNIFKIILNNDKYCIKPMNCPGHIEIFKRYLNSYKNLPLRISEFGDCYRNELSGSLYGLMRLRNFTQDDAHIFCTKNQVNNELNSCIKMILNIYLKFKFKKILVKLSTRPKSRIGSNKIWNKSEFILKKSLNDCNIKYKYSKGKGAFYGPKIEFLLKDSLNRNWQCGTIQLDLFLSKYLNINYINKNNIKKRPVIIHRAILGSIERFIGILTEEYCGKYPIWLSPIQVVLLNINKNSIYYINNIDKILKKNNIRSKIDFRNKKIEFKIREYIFKKIPYIVICGEKEIKNNIISVRSLDNNVKSFYLNDFINKVKYEIKSYSN